MTAYPDTSFLCATYRRQDNSAAADAYRMRLHEPLHATELLQFEFLQSIRLQVWLHAHDKKKGYSQAEADQMIDDWRADLAKGIIEIVPYDASAVARLAEHFSSSHTVGTGNRTLDILHVATAVHLGAQPAV